MKHLMQPVAATLLLAAVCATAALEQRCHLDGEEMDCSKRGLADVPPGYWPLVTRLLLNDNSIAKLYAGSLSGFPNARRLHVHNNPVTVLELGVLADMPVLEDLSFQGCQIHTVVAAPPGVTFNYLDKLYLTYNPIKALDPDVLLSAPNLQQFSLMETAFVVPLSGPILNHPKLQKLNLQVTDARGLNPDSFSGLPSLDDVYLLASGVANISGVFTRTRLMHADITHNPLTELTAGTFLAADSVVVLELQGNALQRLDVSAVNGVVRAGGEIWMSDTPLACSCSYESLYWWAVAKGVTLSAYCPGVACSFLR